MNYVDRITEEQARLAAEEALYVPPTHWEEFKKDGWQIERTAQPQPRGWPAIPT